MAISEAFAGTQSITNDEWDLPTDSTTITENAADGVYQVLLDLSLLVDGDVFRFKAYESVQAGDTKSVFYSQDFANAQGTEDIWISPSFILMHKWTFSLEKITGTDHVITWSIRKVA